MKEALIHPKHPERICWGCEKYCPANDLACREERLAHPIEADGYDWLELERALIAERQTFRLEAQSSLAIAYSGSRGDPRHLVRPGLAPSQ